MRSGWNRSRMAVSRGLMPWQSWSSTEHCYGIPPHPTEWASRSAPRIHPRGQQACGATLWSWQIWVWRFVLYSIWLAALTKGIIMSYTSVLSASHQLTTSVRCCRKQYAAPKKLGGEAAYQSFLSDMDSIRTMTWISFSATTLPSCISLSPDLRAKHSPTSSLIVRQSHWQKVHVAFCHLNWVMAMK